MRIIDNVSELLGDDLKGEIHRGSKVRIAAATFSIFAFEALRKELEHVEQLEFIFTSPSFSNGQAMDKLRKDRREFFIPQAESSLYGSEFEIRLRNKLTQRAIARECADWVRDKVTFRSNATGSQMQQFAVVDDQANPDWAIAFRDDDTKIKHVYFVAETKGSLSTLQLKGVENAKIECARKFFAALNAKTDRDVTYDVVSDYSELMQLVTT